MISVVIVSYNSVDEIRACVASVLKSVCEEPIEVIVADNSSRDETVTIAQAMATEDDRVLLAKGPNGGFSAGVNRGVRASRGRYVLILNPDVLLDPNALAQLVRFMDDHPKVGVVGPKLLNLDGSVQTSCRRIPSVPSLFGNRGIGNFMPIVQAHTARYLMTDFDHTLPEPVAYVLGACMLLRRQALRDVGGMDEGYFLYFEDTQLGVEMWRNGWEVWYYPQVQSAHRHTRSSLRVFSRPFREHIRSAFRFYGRYPFFAFRFPTDPGAIARQFSGRKLLND